METFEYNKINKYDIQGFIYSLLKNTPFENYHNVIGFKFFNFSNIFPVSDFKEDNVKNLIISSPNNFFINNLKLVLNKMETFRLNRFNMLIEKLISINPKKYNKFVTSTPIVLFEDSFINKYFSFKQNNDFNFFFNRLKDNAVKKYNAYTGNYFNLDDDLFNSFEFNREVSVRVTKKDNTFIIIGSLWRSLEADINKNNRDFYKFVLDCGLGEKNSLGFGMVNDLR